MDTNPNKLAVLAGYTVESKDSKWIWRNGDATSDPFDTEVDAWENAEFEVTSDVMGANNVSDQEWDQMSEDEKYLMAHETFSPSQAP